MGSESESDCHDIQRENQKSPDKPTTPDEQRLTTVPVSRLLRDPSPSPELANEEEGNNNGVATSAVDKEKRETARSAYRQRDYEPKYGRRSVLPGRESRVLQPTGRQIDSREASPVRPMMPPPPPRPIGLDSGHKHEVWTVVPSGNSSCDAPEHPRDAKVSRMLRCVDCSYQICDVCERRAEERESNVPRQLGVTDPARQPLSNVRGSRSRPLATRTSTPNNESANANRAPESNRPRPRNLRETLLAVGRKLVSPQRVNEWSQFVDHLNEEERRRVVKAYYQHLGQEVNTESDGSEDETRNRFALAHALRQIPSEKQNPQYFARGTATAPATFNSEVPPARSAAPTATATTTTASTGKKARRTIRRDSAPKKAPLTPDGLSNHPREMCRHGPIPCLNRPAQTTAAAPQTQAAPATFQQAGQPAFQTPAAQTTFMAPPAAVPQGQFLPGNAQIPVFQAQRLFQQNPAAGNEADSWESRVARQASQIAAAQGLDCNVPQNRRWVSLVAIASDALNTLQRENVQPVDTAARIVSISLDRCTSE